MFFILRGQDSMIIRGQYSCKSTLFYGLRT